MAGAAYTQAQRTLHGATAALVLVLLVVGTAMVRGGFGIEVTFTLYQLHKSIGAIVLAIALVRLALRMRHTAPPVNDVARLRQRAATIVHGALYVLMVVIPVTGWLVASASPIAIPYILFGIVEVPPMPALATLPHDARIAAFDGLTRVHRILAWTLAWLVVAHVVGALFPSAHRASVFGRMWGGAP